MKLSVAEIADKIGQTYEGDGNIEIAKVATLENADHHCISFVSNPAYLKEVEHSKAAAIIMREQDKGAATGAAVIISCLLYTSPSPRDATLSRMPSSA